MEEDKPMTIKTETNEALSETTDFDIPNIQRDQNKIYITANHNELIQYYENVTFDATISVKPEKDEDSLASDVYHNVPVYLNTERINQNIDNTTEPSHYHKKLKFRNDIDIKQENEGLIVNESIDIKYEGDELPSLMQIRITEHESTDPPQFSTSDNGLDNMNNDITNSEVTDQHSRDDGRDPLDISDLKQVQEGKK